MENIFKNLIVIILLPCLLLSGGNYTTIFANDTKNLPKEIEIVNDKEDIINNTTNPKELLTDKEKALVKSLSELSKQKQDTTNITRNEINDSFNSDKLNYNISNTSKTNKNTKSNDNLYTYDGGSKIFPMENVKTSNNIEQMSFTLRGEGSNIEVWVADDMNYPKGDTRTIPKVTQKNIDDIIKEFDNNIYKKCTDFFGTPKKRIGKVNNGYYKNKDGDNKIVILISNMKTTKYYNPEDTYNLNGFFDINYSEIVDRNIINFNASFIENNSNNFNTIYAALAHEFQHLIHYDIDPQESVWLNEGLSDFASYVCGYGHQNSDIIDYLINPEISLTRWPSQDSLDYDELNPHYGMSYLFVLYMYGQYGKDFIHKILLDKDQSIKSVYNVLKSTNKNIDFRELYRRFSVATFIDNETIDNGIYDIKNIDLDKDLLEYIEELLQRNKDYLYQENILQQDEIRFDLDFRIRLYKSQNKKNVSAWGTTYKLLEGLNKNDNIQIDFKGNEFLPTSWLKGIHTDKNKRQRNIYYTDTKDTGKSILLSKFDLSNVTKNQKPLLYLNTYLENMNPNANYGRISISTDKENWIFLEPMLTTTSDFVKYEYDISNFAGKKEVFVSFRLMKTPTTDYSIWIIDEYGVKLKDTNQNIYFNDCSKFDETIMSMDEIKQINPVTYSVSIIKESTINGQSKYEVVNFDPFTIGKHDTKKLKTMLKNQKAYMLISYFPKVDYTEPVPYSYSVRTAGNNE